MGNHWANFIDAVRSRKSSDLHAPIEEGAISTTLVHLANISYRLGRTRISMPRVIPARAMRKPIACSRATTASRLWFPKV
jgi:hypothetical protein